MQESVLYEHHSLFLPLFTIWKKLNAHANWNDSINQSLRDFAGLFPDFCVSVSESCLLVQCEHDSYFS